SLQRTTDDGPRTIFLIVLCNRPGPPFMIMGVSLIALPVSTIRKMSEIENGRHHPLQATLSELRSPRVDQGRGPDRQENRVPQVQVPVRRRGAGGVQEIRDQGQGRRRQEGRRGRGRG